MEHCNSTTTSLELKLQLTNDSDEGDIDPTQYLRLLGSPRYICDTRPDLEYIVGMVNKFVQKTKLSHLTATKGILRYIRDTLDYGILFPATNKGNVCKLVGYTDSNWSSNVGDRKSTIGYVFLLGGALVA